LTDKKIFDWLFGKTLDHYIKYQKEINFSFMAFHIKLFKFRGSVTWKLLSYRWTRWIYICAANDVIYVNAWPNGIICTERNRSGQSN